jgi:diguanylate cyclase (GGDEF)-like protein
MTACLVTLVLCPIFASFIVATTLDLHHLESHMRYLASYDMLTDVLTRRLFFSNAERMLAIAKRTEKSFSVAYIDIDNFKLINDKYGHTAGDEVLRKCAELLKSELRKSDIVGRIGGEEFAVCLLDTNIQGAMHLLNQMRMLVKSLSVHYQEHSIQFTISIGLTFVNSYPSVGLETLIEQADKALYQAKATGKDKVVLFQIK